MPLIEPPADADSSPAAARPSEPASGQELAVLPRRSRDLLLRLGSLLCGLAAVSSCLYFSGPAQFGGVVAASGPSQPLGFSARPENGKLLLTWNADSEAARKAKRVVLSITDGDQKEDVDLSLPVFRKGALVYEPVTGRVTLRLTVSEDGAADTVESVQPTGSKGGDVPAAGIAAGGQTANAGTDAAAAASPPSDPRPSAAPAPAAHSPSIRDIPEPQAMDAQVKLVPVTTGLGEGISRHPPPCSVRRRLKRSAIRFRSARWRLRHPPLRRLRPSHRQSAIRLRPARSLLRPRLPWLPRSPLRSSGMRLRPSRFPPRPAPKRPPGR